MTRLVSLLTLALIALVAHAAGPLDPDANPAGVRLRIGTTHFRHAGPIRSVAFSPDGKYLASASLDRTVSVWQVPGGRELYRLTGHQGAVYSVSYSGDGKLLATGAHDGHVRIWNVADGQLAHKIAIEGEVVEAVAFSPTQSLLAATDTIGKVHIFSSTTGKKLHSVDSERNASSLAWSADGTILAVNGGSLAYTLIEAKSGKVLLRAGMEPTDCLAFSPRGTELVTWEEGTMRLWDAPKGRQIRSWKADDKDALSGGAAISQIAFNRDGTRVIAGTPAGPVGVWDPATGKLVRRLVAIGPRPLAVAASPKSGLIAVGSSAHVIQVWDTGTGKEMSPIRTPAAPVLDLSIPRKGEKLALVLGNGRVELREPHSGKLLATPTIQDVRQAVFTPDGKTLFVASPTVVRKVTAGKVVDIPTAREFSSLLTDLTMATDGALLVTTHRDGNLYIRDHTGKELRPCQVRERGVRPVLAPDNATLAGVGSLAAIPMWDVESGDPRPPLPGHSGGTLAGAFTPNSRMFLSAGHDRRLRFWEVLSGQERRSSIPLESVPKTLAVSQRGHLVALGDADGTIRLYSALSGTLLATRHGHRGAVSKVAFADGDRELVSAGQDTCVLVWDVSGVEEKTRAVVLKAAQREQHWKELLEDADVAWKASQALSRDPGPTVEFLRSKTKPPDGKTIAQLIEKLDNASFLVRDKAYQDLSQMGTYAGPALRKALTERPPLERFKSITKLLKTLGDGRPTGEQLRMLRTIELLEHVGTKEAQATLEALSKGSEMEVSRQAREALLRLWQR